MASDAQKILENSLLIADPSLCDGIFDRTVIHISEHSEEGGAVGYILNKPTEKTVGEILMDPSFKELWNLPIYFGGPVGTDHIVFSVYWWEADHTFKYRLRVSAEEAKVMKRRPGSILLAHVGHSSWHEGQLERELQEESWVSMPVSENTLSVGAKSLWKTLLGELSPFHKLLSLTPEEIEKN